MNISQCSICNQPLDEQMICQNKECALFQVDLFEDYRTAQKEAEQKQMNAQMAGALAHSPQEALRVLGVISQAFENVSENLNQMGYYFSQGLQQMGVQVAVLQRILKDKGVALEEEFQKVEAEVLEELDKARKKLTEEAKKTIKEEAAKF